MWGSLREKLPLLGPGPPCFETRLGGTSEPPGALDDDRCTLELSLDRGFASASVKD